MSYTYLKPIALIARKPPKIFWFLLAVELLAGFLVIAIPFPFSTIPFVFALLLLACYGYPLLGLVILIPCLPNYGLDFFTITGESQVSLLEPAVAFAVLCWVIRAVRTNNFEFHLSPIDAALASILMWLVVSLIWTPAVGRGAHHIVKVLTGLLAYYSIVNLVDSKKSFRLVIWVWLVLSVGLALHGVYETVTVGATASQQLVIKEGYTHLGRAVRTTSLVQSPDNLGIMLNLSIVLASVMLLRSRSKKLKVVLGISLCVMLVSLVATFSRKSYLGTAGAVMFVLVTQKGRLQILLGGFIAAGLAVVVMLTAFPSLVDVFLHRLSTYLAPLEVSISERAVTWQFALDLFKESPLLGHGIGSFYVIASEAGLPLLLVHNFYIFVVTELGLVGLGLVIFWMVQIAGEYGRFLENNPQRQKRILAAGMIGGVIGLVIQAAFRTFGFTDPIFWGYLGVTSAFWKVYGKGSNHSDPDGRLSSGSRPA